MSTVLYACGCAVFRSMFGDREILDIHHYECDQHLQMAKGMEGRPISQVMESMAKVLVEDNIHEARWTD